MRGMASEPCKVTLVSRQGVSYVDMGGRRNDVDSTESTWDRKEDAVVLGAATRFSMKLLGMISFAKCLIETSESLQSRETETGI